MSTRLGPRKSTTGCDHHREPNGNSRRGSAGRRVSSISSLLQTIRQQGFELSLHPFKRAAQLNDDRTVCEVRAVHVVRYGRHSKPSPARVLGTNEKPKTESADRQRRHPCGNCIAAQATEEPGGNRRYQSHAADQNRVVHHSNLCFCTGDTA
jgi:hypothetical protein